jgi:HlyD family secretion protein
LVIGLAIVGVIVYAFLPKPVPVDVAAVKRGRIEQTVDEDGRTRIKERYVVSAPLSGLMQRIERKPGDAVYANKTLITQIEPTEPALLDPRAKAEARARVLSAEGSIKQAEAKIALRNRRTIWPDRSRTNRSCEIQQHRPGSVRRSGTGADVPEELRIAESALIVAQHEKAVAEAALIRTEPRKSGEPNRESFPIVSPISGKVLRVFQESAVVATMGMKLIEIGDPSDLEVEIDVLSRDGARIKPGALVYLEHWGGEKPLKGSVRLVEPSAFLKISALGVEEQRVNVIVDLVDPVESAKRSAMLSRRSADRRRCQRECIDRSRRRCSGMEASGRSTSFRMARQSCGRSRSGTQRDRCGSSRRTRGERSSGAAPGRPHQRWRSRPTAGTVAKALLHAEAIERFLSAAFDPAWRGM